MALYYYDKKTNYRTTPKGAKIHLTPGGWSSLAAISHCPCEDGKRRFVRITGQPDTYWTVPARVSIYSKEKRGNVTVSGFVMYDDEGEPRFIGTGKNKDIIKKENATNEAT